jgi:hypothetical protein
MGRDLIFTAKNFVVDLVTDATLRVLDEFYYTVRDVREIAYALTVGGGWGD